MAKEMLPVVDKPLIQYAVEEARAAGIDQFCLITGRGKTALVEHFDIAYELERTLKDRGKIEALEVLRATQVEPGSMVAVRQQEPHGLGHAIWCARAFIGERPVRGVAAGCTWCCPKQPCLKPSSRRSITPAPAATSSPIAEVPREHTNRYGIVRIPPMMTESLVEVQLGWSKNQIPRSPRLSNLSVIGRYILTAGGDRATCRDMERGRWQRGAAHRRNGPDDRPRSRSTACATRAAEFDCGDKVGFLEAQIAFALKRPDMAAAVRTFLKNYVDRLMQRSDCKLMRRCTFGIASTRPCLREYDIRGVVGRNAAPCGGRVRHRPVLRQRRCGRGRQARWPSVMTAVCPAPIIETAAGARG